MEKFCLKKFQILIVYSTYLDQKLEFLAWWTSHLIAFTKLQFSTNFLKSNSWILKVYFINRCRLKTDVKFNKTLGYIIKWNFLIGSSMYIFHFKELKSIFELWLWGVPCLDFCTNPITNFINWLPLALLSLILFEFPVQNCYFLVLWKYFTFNVVLSFICDVSLVHFSPESEKLFFSEGKYISVSSWWRKLSTNFCS